MSSSVHSRSSVAAPAVPDLPVGSGHHLVVRRRLLDLLDEAVRDSRLTLVSAPAGSGKTSLVSTWAAHRTVRGPLVWVTTDSREKGRRAFWQRVTRGLEDSVQRQEDLGAHGDPKRLAAATRRIARRVGPVMLVVDEGPHRVDPALRRELDQYLRQSGEALRLIFLTRADPVLPLHRYRVAHQLSEIRVGDLRFTPAETAALFSEAGVEVTDAHIATLLQKTGGWPAGLAFAVSFLQGRSDVEEAVVAFTGSDRAVSDFLVKEFLDAQPPNVREVLLRSSVADELPVGLFESLTGAPDGPAVLAFLNRANTFLSPAPGSAHSYQYPPLMREFLRTRLALEHPQLVPELHEVAAMWWYRNGSVPEAVRHAVAAGQWDHAAWYVVEGLAIGEVLNDRVDTLAASFHQLPATVDSPRVAVVRGALALRQGGASETRGILDALRVELAGGSTAIDFYDLDWDDPLLFCLELLESGIAAVDHDIAGLDAVRRAERHLQALHPSRDTLPELWGLLATYRSKLQLWSGDVPGARASLAVVAGSARMAHETAWEVSAQSQGAVLAAVVGELATALDLADRAEEQMRVQVNPTEEDAARMALARSWVLAERDLVGAAGEELSRAEEIVDAEEAVDRGLLAIVRSRLLHAQGYYSAARAVLTGLHGAPLGNLPRWLGDYMRVARQVQAAAEGTSAPAEPVLALEGWHGELPLEIRVSGAVLQAGARLKEGGEGAAVSELQHSLDLAAPQAMRRPFTEAPPEVRNLLLGRTEVQMPQSWLSTTGTSAPPGGEATPVHVPQKRRSGEKLGPRHGTIVPAVGAAGQTVLVEELTAKELEVLEHLGELHTTEEIAAGMFISVNTVRTHVRNILRKLGVDRRNQAVRRAWDLGLLDQPSESHVRRL